MAFVSSGFIGVVFVFVEKSPGSFQEFGPLGFGLMRCHCKGLWGSCGGSRGFMRVL